MLKCAVFDFDGTLFDSMPLWDSAGERYLRSLGIEPKPNVREEIRAMSLDQSALYFQKEYSLTFSAEEILAGIRRTVEYAYLHEILPKPGAAGFLARMKEAGIPMCIASASERYQVDAALVRCGLDGYFDAVFTCGEIGCGKDSPEIFRRAMERFRADRETTVVFEDALHAIQTAKADGFLVAAVFDASEKHQPEVRRLSDFYLTDYGNADKFWEFVSA